MNERLKGFLGNLRRGCFRFAPFNVGAVLLAAFLIWHNHIPWKERETAGLIPISGQATKHYNVRKFSGDGDPQYQPKIDGLAPLAHVGKDFPPIVSICGEPPYEWKARAEENRLLIASCVAMGHPFARYVECPLCDHGRVAAAARPYIEMFVRGKLP